MEVPSAKIPTLAEWLGEAQERAQPPDDLTATRSRGMTRGAASQPLELQSRGLRGAARSASPEICRGDASSSPSSYSPSRCRSEQLQRRPAKLRSASLHSRLTGGPCGRILTGGIVEVELWELQRRITIFHREWRAPFLPHDGKKKWRWVDASYGEHPWISCSRASAILSELPPVTPPEGWQPEAGESWKVVLFPGLCDEDGWQYATDFYKNDIWWVQLPALYHCRRRLWRCSFHFSQTSKAPFGELGAVSHREQESNLNQGRVGALPSHASLSPSSQSDVPELPMIIQDILPPLPLELEAERLLADDWAPGNIILDFLKAMGSTDIEVGPWDQDGPMEFSARGEQDDTPTHKKARPRAAGRRRLTMRMLVPPAPLAPRTTRATSIYNISQKDETGRKSICIDIKLKMHDIPYGDYFNVQERITMTLQEDGMAVAKMATTQFSKSTFVQSAIDSRSKADLRQTGEQFLKFLRERRRGTAATSQSFFEIRQGDQSVFDVTAAASCGKREPLRSTSEGHPMENIQREAGSGVRMTRILEASLPPLRLALEAERLLAEEWLPGTLVVDYLVAMDQENRNSLTVTGARRVDQQHGHARMRSVSAWFPLYFGKVTRVTADCKVSTNTKGMKDVSAIYIETKLTLHDIPFSENFWIQEKLSLEALPDGNIFVAKDAGVEFPETATPLSGWLRAVIETSHRLSQQKVGREFLEFLRQRTTETNNSSPKAPVPSVMEVWELQRRITLFHSTWRAPFLPHDMQKKWRWVDKGYRKHPWTIGALESASISEMPPIEPPGGSAKDRQVDWAVVRDPELCDKDGWQYAVDFYENGNLWFPRPRWNHCRRRLWRRFLDVGLAEDSCPVSAGVKTSVLQGSAPCYLCWGLGMLLLILVLILVFLVLPQDYERWMLAHDVKAYLPRGHSEVEVMIDITRETRASTSAWPLDELLSGCGAHNLSEIRPAGRSTMDWWRAARSSWEPPSCEAPLTFAARSEREQSQSSVAMNPSSKHVE